MYNNLSELNLNLYNSIHYPAYFIIVSRQIVFLNVYFLIKLARVNPSDKFLDYLQNNYTANNSKFLSSDIFAKITNNCKSFYSKLKNTFYKADPNHLA